MPDVPPEAQAFVFAIFDEKQKLQVGALFNGRSL
jgi:hypothetical protein